MHNVEYTVKCLFVYTSNMYTYYILCHAYTTLFIIYYTHTSFSLYTYPPFLPYFNPLLSPIFQQVVVTPPGQVPPPIGQPFTEDPVSALVYIYYYILYILLCGIYICHIYSIVYIVKYYTCTVYTLYT